MLDDICAEIRNYFIRNPQKDIHRGRFTISSNRIEVLPFLVDGQYFRIVGSALNDGVYVYSSDVQFKDETFDGEIWAMTVPPSVIALEAEISGWIHNNASVIDSPYQSESFGGYSYTKASGGSDGSTSADWQNHFRKRLNPYRKVSVL